jgi:hypothetical protein
LRYTRQPSCIFRVRGPPHPQWWERAVGGTLDLSLYSSTLTRIYAYDYFIHNVDRHFNNILAREQHSGVALMALDYSRAWIIHGFPLPSLPFSSSDNTVAAQRDLAGQCGQYVNPGEARSFLELIKRVPTTTVRQIISAHPKEWLSAKMKTAILKWWSSDDRISRIEGIAKGIEDGTYL